MAIDRADSPYRRGNRYEMMPIPMEWEHSLAVDAGTVQLVVESRRLTNQILTETYGSTLDAEVDFEDAGASLHVCGPDGREHLRFDCFENEPHYHYIEQETQSNTIVRIDELAVGDPIEFTLRCLSAQLAPMLRRAGAIDLADGVTREPEAVDRAIDEVRSLMVRTRAATA